MPARIRTRPALAAALLAAVLAVGGCTDSGGDADSAEAGSARADAKAQGAAPREGGGADAGGAGDSADSRAPRGGATAAEGVTLAPQALVRTAAITVRTKDLAGAADSARTLAEGAGGYVGDESTSQEPGAPARARLTLRVPAAEYDAVLGDLAELGRVVNRDVEVKDVTDEVVDVDSRVRSQRASVARIRDLMDDATKLADVVTLEGELGTRQADLEALLAQQSSLKERTELGTITLELRRPAAAPPADEDDGTSVTEALAGGWDAFVTGLRGVLIAVSASLPFAALLVLLALAWRWLRGRLPRRHVTPPPSPFPGQPTPQGGEPE
ncbi:DUF4349 domain-containing protein [Streptomyces sp. CMB-StM0423]|uniref:DUF4349 domain-containing protein n=1 Tax=Streptomyces sp. CMB-StM0423 TaxID=2059884 RepID=UPI000C707FE7|nr:DUF4349 domain-containing protein [Streptomyces sp. CMB-StM0423]AUH39851.1 DUF4349 domain-containing protein [Streptomyces sp. CMB-StM0423]